MKHYGRFLPELTPGYLHRIQELEVKAGAIEVLQRKIEQMKQQLAVQERQFIELSQYRYTEDEIEEAKHKATGSHGQPRKEDTKPNAVSCV